MVDPDGATCPRCGAPLSAGDPAGLCPRCLPPGTPGDAEALFDRGVALQGQGKLAEAVAAFREAIRLRPDLASAHCNLGLALRAERKRTSSR